MRNHRMIRIHAVACLALGAVSLWGQTTTTPPAATCTTAPTSITAFSIEQELGLTNLLTTLTPNIPTNVLAALSSGAQVIRDRLVYNPQQNTLTSTVFLVAPGSPIPTPILTNITGQTLVTYTINISQTFFSCTPTPSVLFVGTISASGGGPLAPSSPFGNLNGALAAVSVGYTTATPPTINNVVLIISGTVDAYSASGAGTITFPAAPVTPPGTASAPMVVTNPPANSSEQVFFNNFTVSALQSTDPNGLALTYQWTAQPGVTFLPSPQSPNPIIQFSATGAYTITVTVTDSAGASAASTFTLVYLPSR
jgi:hypothetical protein